MKREEDAGKVDDVTCLAGGNGKEWERGRPQGAHPHISIRPPSLQ
jgi:hypothetical protein